MTPEEIATLPPVKPEPVRTCVSAVCLLLRRMLGSLDRRSLLESVQAVRGRYMHVRTGNARPQPAVPTGAGLKKNCACCWRAGQPAIARAAARRTARQPSVWGSRPPPAARHTRCAGNGLAAMSLRRYVFTPLCLYAAMSLRRYVATLLCRYAAMSLRRYVSFRLCRYVAVPRGVHTRV